MISPLNFNRYSKTCHECHQGLAGRNYTMEKIASLLLEVEESKSSSIESSEDSGSLSPTAPGANDDDVLNLTSISDTSV